MSVRYPDPFDKLRMTELGSLTGVVILSASEESSSGMLPCGPER
jgi:hypothetical protein